MLRRLITAGAVLTLGVLASSPPLSISLETSWPAPPLLLEILETVYDEAPDSYFPLLRLVTGKYAVDDRPEEVLDSVLDLITSHSLLPELTTFNLALGLHMTAPRIEAAYSWSEHNRANDEECETWVEWRGKGFCELDELKRDMELSLEEGSHNHTQRPKSLPFDRPSRSTTGAQAILYFDPYRSADWIHYLDQHSTVDTDFSYIVRYRPDRQGRSQHRKTKLAGYGVELALKKTDYLVVDDRDTGAPGETSSSGDVSAVEGGLEGSSFGEILGEDPWAELATPLTKFEILDLGLKTSALIMSASDQLEALRELSQDFPKYSAAISRKVAVPDSMKQKAKDLARRGPDTPAIYINGKAHSHPELNAYTLLKHIRAEKKLATALTSLGLTPKQAFQLLADPVIGQKQTAEEAGEGVVDSSDRLEGGEVVVWWNNIEKDTRYKQWPASTSGYLRPTYPGQLHTVRKNTWNVILVLDLAQASSLDTITEQISHMIQRGVPVRFGVVPMFDSTNNDISQQMARLYYYCVKTFGRIKTQQLFTEVASMTAPPTTPNGPSPVKIQLVQNAYERLQTDSTKESLPFERVIASDSQVDKLKLAQQYQSRLLATKSESPTGHLFINGKYYAFVNHWTSLVQNELATQVQFLQEQIQSGYPVLDISTFFYDLPGVSSRRSKLIVPSSGEYGLKAVNILDQLSADSTKRIATDFVYPANADRATPMTMWIIGDLNSADGLQMVRNALTHLQSDACVTRLGFIHNSPDESSTASAISTILYQLLSGSALQSLAPKDLLSLLDGVLQAKDSGDNVDRAGRIYSEESQQVFVGTPLHAFTSSGWNVADGAAAAQFWKVGSEIAASLGIKPGQTHILVNGRLVGSVTPTTFPAGDFAALEQYEYRKRAKPVVDLLKTMYDDLGAFDRATFASLVSGVSSILTTAYNPDGGDSIFIASPTPRNHYYETLDRGSMSFTIGNAETALVRIAAVLDPVSEEAQVWSGLLKTAAAMDNIAVSVYLEPDVQNTELKLKRFYRSSIPLGLSFDIDGQEADFGVTFTDLPADPIYTLALDTPPAWIASPIESPYDLDNLQLSAVNSPVHVTFQLKQLLIEGHARERTNSPPRGLQLQLTRNGVEVSDTLVMANVGYMQFKVTPGVYDLVIRPGRGRDVFELESTGTAGWDSLPVNETGTEVTLMSLEGVTILPRFARQPGMDTEDVLQEPAVSVTLNAAGAIWSRMKQLVGLDSSPAMATRKHADINIFTVASGLLYERFASIMILSVMKHTQSTVKFWFIENFLSPTFIAFIPHLAQEYGFEYELVTYKWPHWLRAQTEKQRIIWAYKILFLDVLFPMDLDKVIFVDADQIVRTDMQQLVDLDLQGHVYGYPPMGNDRTEMEGFRFWKTGYWREALRGRPYHISALYVVDLKRFRQLATGDQLRGRYHALSADPNSLANLDQDLPNSMQDTIPIFTLDQDWLWCQTWCSDGSLATAKTIDLCQNPLTKEPKLVRARQIPEWDVYDREIAAFAKRIEGKTGKGMAGSVDALAGGIKDDEDTMGEQEAAEEEGSKRIEDEL